MSGLYQRALEFFKNLPQPSEEEFSFDDQSGISRDDQKEILKEIEIVANQSRISVTPEIFTIKAIKRGTLLPLMINIGAIVVLAVGGFFLYYLFQRGESTLMQEAGAITTAEGQLIEELKKESEAKLLEKNREINSIQNRLSEIDKERADLQSNMESKVLEREQELRQVLETELANERQRLQAQGVSEDDINQRLQQLESEKNNQFQEQLASFRQEAEAERQQAEESLRALQDEYSQQMEAAEADRQQVLADSRQREDELRSQLAEKTEALEAEKLQADQQLRRLSEQKAQEDLASEQLIGLYNTVEKNMRSGDLNEALLGLDGIVAYLNDDAVATLPGMLQRRDVELFVVDSIRGLVESERHKEEVDTATLVASANLVTQIKNQVLEGDDLLAQGEVSKAEILYREALSQIPEVRRSHEHLLGQSTVDAAKQQQLRDYLQRAEIAFQNKDYDSAVQNYTQALRYLPEEERRIDQMVSQLRQSGLALGLESFATRDSGLAAEPLRQANTLLEGEQYSQAIAAYIDLVTRYPFSSQVQPALGGIRDAAAKQGSGGTTVELEQTLAAKTAEVAAVQSALEEKTDELAALRKTLSEEGGEASAFQQTIAEQQTAIDQLETSLAEQTVNLNTLQAALAEREGALENLETSLAESGSTVESLQSTLAERDNTLESLQSTLAEREEELARLRERLAESTGNLEEGLQERLAQVETLQNENELLNDEIAALQTEIRQLQQAQAQAPEEALTEEIKNRISRLENIRKNYNAIRESYSNYAIKEDMLLKSKGETGLIEAKLHLNTFLASTDETFPGLWDRIKRYDAAFEQAGRSSAVEDINEIVYELSLRDRAEAKILFLESEMVRSREDALMNELLDELKYVFQNE